MRSAWQCKVGLGNRKTRGAVGCLPRKFYFHLRKINVVSLGRGPHKNCKNDLDDQT